jgi:flagellar biogenesis protein FliO
MYINTQHTQQSAVFEELDLQADMAKLSAALALILATALINAKAMVNF